MPNASQDEEAMTTGLAKRSTNGVAVKARPLGTLTPLIKAEIRHGFEAGQRHWLAVGRLLNEARGHFPTSGPNDKGLTFHQWVRETFTNPMSGEPLAERTVQRWMQGAKALPDSRRAGGNHADPQPTVTSMTNDYRMPSSPAYKPNLDWKAGVRRVQQTINVEALADKWNDDEREERELRKLAKQIITAGYRALAAVVHPDKKGGSTEAMKKLTAAKKWLEEAIAE